MKYFRLINKAHASTPLGYGRSGGRWNLSGTPVIYASSTTAITFLELLSIKGPVVASTSWVLLGLEVRGDIAHLMAEDLPMNWSRRPHPSSTQNFGTQWAQAMASPFLKVPSCRIPLSGYPAEHNLLINPLHRDTSGLLKVISQEDVPFELNEWG